MDQVDRPQAPWDADLAQSMAMGGTAACTYLHMRAKHDMIADLDGADIQEAAVKIKVHAAAHSDVVPLHGLQADYSCRGLMQCVRTTWCVKMIAVMKMRSRMSPARATWLLQIAGAHWEAMPSPLAARVPSGLRF